MSVDDGVIQVGTPLRDAAVDPRPGDFLPPTNAGEPGPEGNPHGPSVVSLQANDPMLLTRPGTPGRRDVDS